MRNATQPIVLSLPAGVCCLRRQKVEGLSRKEAEASLQLWADESLPAPTDQYFTHSWRISNTEIGLAALPRDLLQDRREQLRRSTKHVRSLIVPELRPPQHQGHGIVLWQLRSGFLACIWDNRVLTNWQCFTRGRDARHCLAQLSASMDGAPEWIAMVPDSREPPDNNFFRQHLSKAIELHWPDVRTDVLSNKARQFFLTGPKFEQFINEYTYQPANTANKWRLGFAVSGLVAALMILIFSELAQREDEIDSLHHIDLVQSARASRSEQIASRSSGTLQQVYDLRALTVERHGILNVLKGLSDALPPEVKYTSVSIDRSGPVQLDGLATSEIDISTLLERFNRMPEVQRPVLMFAEKSLSAAESEDANALRFRIELELAKSLLTVPGISDNSDAVVDSNS